MARPAFKKMVLAIRPDAEVIAGTPRNGLQWVGGPRYAIGDFGPLGEWDQMTDCFSTAMNAWREYHRALSARK